MAVRPTYVSLLSAVVMVAWYTTSFTKHCPVKGHLFGSLQLQTSTPLYVHSKSNHPPCIIKNIPEAINKRLSEISSDEETFKKATAPYQEALHKSGYSYTLKFSPPQQQSPESATNKRKRQRNIIWFNPPFSKNVQTNIGREFRNLIDNCFPPNHKLRKLFNKTMSS